MSKLTTLLSSSEGTQKIGSEYEEVGRSIARGFQDELSKLADEPAAAAANAVAKPGFFRRAGAKSLAGLQWVGGLPLRAGAKVFKNQEKGLGKLFAKGLASSKAKGWLGAIMAASGLVGTGLGARAIVKKHKKHAEDQSVKMAALQYFYGIGVDAAFDALEKSASAEQVEKVAEERAAYTLEKVAKSVSLQAADDICEFLIKVGEEEAAEKLADAIVNGIDENDIPVNAELTEEDLAELPEEEAGDAAVQGAAEVISEATGQPVDSQEVQDAAAEVVEQAVAGSAE